jgi:flagellar motility protein MotE (MotC chaperone)
MNWQRSMVLTAALALGFGLVLLNVAPAGASSEPKKEKTGGATGIGEHGTTEGEEGESSELDGPRPPLPWEVPRAIENQCTKEEIVLLRELRERSELLDLRSAALDEREGAIEDAERLLASRLAKIESIRADIVGKLDAERSMILATIREEQTSRRNELEKEQSARLKKIEEEQAIVLAAIARDRKVKAERVLELAGIVATMKSKAAAAMLAGMDEGIALQVLLELRPKTAGKILAAMPSITAQSLGDQMTVYKDPLRGLGGSAGSAGGSGSAADRIPPPPSTSVAPSGAPADSAGITPTNN